MREQAVETSADSVEETTMTSQTENNDMPLLRRCDSEVASHSSSIVSTSQSLKFGQFLGAVANLCSATLGAGILALPFALYQAGLFFGGLLLLSSAWATASSINLLVLATDQFQLSTYEKVVEKVLGRRARQAVEISILIFCGGTAVAYVIAVGDIMQRVEDLSLFQKRIGMVLVWLLAMLPLSCLRRMKSLQCASTVGIASIGTLLLAATVHLVHPQNDYFSVAGQSLKPFLGPADGGWISVLRACPIVFFAFSCQVNVCQIYDELPGRGQEKVKSMKWVTWCSVGLCGLLYTSVSLVTLMDFGKDVTPNILSCYKLSSKDTLLHVAFSAMALAVVMAFPLNIFPARVSLIQMWASAKKREQPMLRVDSQDANQEAKQPLLSSHEERNDYDIHEGLELEPAEEDPLRLPILTEESSITEDEDHSTEDDPEFHLGEHMGITLLVAASALGLALVVPNISVVFGLLGGTTSSLLGFVVPGLLGLELDRSNASAWILVVGGTLIGILTTGVTVYSL